jgi:YD repeat-containing protein
MKKIVSILIAVVLLLTICLSVVSCNSQNKDTTTQSNQNDKDYDQAIKLLDEEKYEESKALFEKLGDYKDSEEYLSKFYYLPAWIYNDIIGKGGSYEYSFDENNLISKYVVHREGMDAYCDFFYYENGDIKTQSAYINGATQSFEYTYNANRQRESAVHTIDGVVTYIHSFEYDEKGNEIVFRIDDVEGNLVQLITRTFDEHGNRIKVEYAFDNYEVTYAFNYDLTYNDVGMLIREVCHYPDGTQETLDHIRDDKGNEVQRILTYDDGDQDVWEFTYDENGNMVKEVLTNYEGVVQYLEYEYVLFYLPTGLTDATRIFFTEIFEEQL